MSTRLRNGVVVWKRIEYKGHHHVQKPQTFCKGRAVSELSVTPLWRTLIESGHKLILGHSPQTLIGRIVGKLYPRNPKHIRNKLRCDRNRNTLDLSNKMSGQSSACWSRTPKSTQKDKWRARYKETPIPDYEWQWEGRCQQNDPRWLSVSNECLIKKSFP